MQQSCVHTSAWTEVRREEEQRERWSVFLMESDSQVGGRGNNTEKTFSCAHSPALLLSHTYSSLSFSQAITKIYQVKKQAAAK